MGVRFASGFAVACALGLAVEKSAAQGSDTSRAPSSGYTAEQATRGDLIFRRVCAECHETLEYTGPEFRSKWNGRPAFELFDLIRSTMPEEAPGSLTAQQYADVLAYMLKLNTVPAGQTPLPTADADLKKVRLEIPAGGSQD
jgi:mono/diheme cytochrome c family protein